jgi:hypothetical protein
MVTSTTGNEMETGTPSLNFHFSSSKGIFYYMCRESVRTKTRFYTHFTAHIAAHRVRYRVYFSPGLKRISDWQLMALRRFNSDFSILALGKFGILRFQCALA